MDPRVKATAADLAEQFAFSKQLFEARPQLERFSDSFLALNTGLAKARDRAAQVAAVTPQLDGFAKTLAQFAPKNTRNNAPPSFEPLDNLTSLFSQLQEADAGPRPSVKAAVADFMRELPGVIERWQIIVAQDLPALNAQLDTAGVGHIDITGGAPQ
jgi:hypothetical protein